MINNLHCIGRLRAAQRQGIPSKIFGIPYFGVGGEIRKDAENFV